MIKSNYAGPECLKISFFLLTGVKMLGDLAAMLLLGALHYNSTIFAYFCSLDILNTISLERNSAEAIIIDSQCSCAKFTSIPSKSFEIEVFSGKSLLFQFISDISRNLRDKLFILLKRFHLRANCPSTRMTLPREIRKLLFV